MAAAEREVVHSEHGQRHGLRVVQAAQYPQQAVATGREPQAGREPDSGTSCQRDRDRRQRPRQQRRPPCPCHGEFVGLLGECPRRAGGVVAEEPPDLQAQLHRPAPDRRVGQAPLVPAVHPSRRVLAPRARRFLAAEPSVQDHSGTNLDQALDRQRREVRQQPTKITSE
nr:hypothetical protein [Pseudonocardia sp. HH130630-07]